MSPIIFSIGNFEVRWYSVLILLGVILAYAVVYSESRRFQIKNEFIFNLGFYALIFGIIGARLYYVVFNWDYYSLNISEIPKIWHGGLAIHGGLLFGLIAIAAYTSKYHVNFKKILDIIAPGVLLAQAIGRWGNFFNGEAYGFAVKYDTLVKMKIIPSFVIDNMYINGSFHLPMFYFESLACIVGFIIMLFLRRRKYAKNGQTFGFYLVWYGTIRFVIEIFRTDSLMLLDFKAAQVVSALMVLFGLYLIFMEAKKPKLDDLYDRVDHVVS